MKHIGNIAIVCFLFLSSIACNAPKKELIAIDQVQPWCILGFDSLNRTPKERITMLKKLGLSTYGYNKGKGHLEEMVEEFKLAKENNIEISAVFMYLNAKRDSLNKLSPYNKQLLSNLKNAPFKPTIWLTFSNNFFEDKNQKESIQLSVEMIRFAKTKADSLDCKLALYNHRGWFGNPHNQLNILQQLNDPSIKMVYNFHHAHEYVDEFAEIAKEILPYLCHVNLNGIIKEGPEILAIGKGDYEYEMIKTLQNEGFNRTWGILGHIKTEDVEKVLLDNIEGLKILNEKFSKE